MSALTTPLPPRAVRVDDPVFRLSVATYHAMIASGDLKPDDPVELVEGALLFKMPIDEIHAAIVGVLDDLIQPLLTPHGLVYRQQQPVTLDDGEPQPDGAIVQGPRHRFAKLGRPPLSEEVTWVAEVANSSLRTDRGIKLRSYARAGIETYWILNLADKVIEVYTDPDAKAAEPTYRTMTPYRAGQRIPVVVQGNTVGDIAIDDVLLA